MTKLNHIHESLKKEKNYLDVLLQKEKKNIADLEFIGKNIKRQMDKITLAEFDLEKEYERLDRNETANNRRKAQELSKKYDIPIINNSGWEGGQYFIDHWVSKPDWLKSDPLEDGHFGENWTSTLWIIEFYAKHHPKHPDYQSREFLQSNPHC